MNLHSLYSLFGLSDTETAILEALLLTGPQKAGDLARQIKTNRTTVYNYLDRLLQAGLVYETIKNGVKMFVVQPYEKINLLIQAKEYKFQEARETLRDLKNIYSKQNSSFQPRIQIFETQAELRQMMNDLLLYNDITVRAYWPIGKVLETLGSDFVAEFNQKRQGNRIKLRTIWPHNQVLSSKQYKFLATGPENKREVRIAPSNINFSLGYAVYKNTVRFISSSRENFGFLIESAELAEMMIGQFELIWQSSRPLKN